LRQFNKLFFKKKPSKAMSDAEAFPPQIALAFKTSGVLLPF
jgi:hypothetical protein